jgi:hypothetical protein
MSDLTAIRARHGIATEHDATCTPAWAAWFPANAPWEGAEIAATCETEADAVIMVLTALYGLSVTRNDWDYPERPWCVSGELRDTIGGMTVACGDTEVGAVSVVADRIRASEPEAVSR